MMESLWHFDNCSFIFLVLSCGQTNTSTYTQTDADDRYTSSTLVGVSNKQRE